MAAQIQYTLPGFGVTTRHCIKCLAYQPATGHLGETRQWRGNICPSCYAVISRLRKRQGAPERIPRAGDTPYNISKVYRQRSKAMPKDITKATKNEINFWQVKRTQWGFRKIDWLVMYYKQEGLCAICQCPIGRDQKTAIDHDHRTGAIRGLLCQACNVKMAALDDPGWLERAMAYKG